MLKLPIYNQKELKLAFEFGLILSEVAKDRDVKLTKEMSTQAQYILINELKTRGFKKTSLDFVPLILAVFEINK